MSHGLLSVRSGWSIILSYNFHSASGQEQISIVLGELIMGKICLQINQSWSHGGDCYFIYAKPVL